MSPNHKFAFHACLFLSIASIPLSSASAQDDLVMNPGFEEPGVEGAHQWTFYLTAPEDAGDKANTQGRVKQDAENPHSGEYSLHIEGDGPSWAGVYQVVEGLQPGAEYKLTAWARANSSNQRATVSVLFRMQDDDKRGSAHRLNINPDPSGDWQEFTSTFTLPQESLPVIRLDLRCMPRGGDTAEIWFDDISLEQVSS